MARTDSKWMPLYISDYLGDTMHLSRAQHGSYLLLLMAYWKRGGPLPDDDIELAAIAKCSPAEWKRDRAYLAKLFQVADGEWRQGRADRELERADAKTKAKAEAGAKGAAKRWQTDGTATPLPMANESLTDAPLPLPSQLSSDNHSPSENVARAPKPVKGTRLALDWRPCEEARAYARNLGLGDGEIQAEANEFREYFTGKDCAKPVKRDWLAAWQRWVRNNAPKRIRNRPRGPAARGASPTAARNSILAKAGIRRGEAGFVHPDPECGASRGIAGEASSGTVIDADGWREVPGSADGDETADTPQPGIDGGLGGTARCLPQAADGIPGGRGVLRADDAAGNLAVVAGMGGTEGAVGGFDAPEEADAGGSDLDIPAFLDRRHKLSA